jgi:hypothetical protein
MKSEMEELRMRIVDEIAQEAAVSSRGQRRQRTVKRKMSNWPVKKKDRRKQAKINISQVIEVFK